MKKYRTIITVEEVFQYDNAEEKQSHEDVMINEGYIVSPVPTLMRKNLMAGYSKNECTYENN